MHFGFLARADRRAPLGAALAGAGMGLGLGAAFLLFGLVDRTADYAYARELTHAAASGYAGEPPEAPGLGAGLAIYGLTFGADAVESGPAGEARPGPTRRSELECLTSAVYYEARGESDRGQAAVAQVVLNRVKHPAFPGSVCAVVYQGAGRKGCQFSFACDGSARRPREPLAWDRARAVATRALAGVIQADIGAATHFHTTAVSPVWAPQMLRVANVGAHVFYRFAPYRVARNGPSPSTIDRAVMTAATSVRAPDLVLASTLESAIEASLEARPAPKDPAKPTEPKPPEVAREAKAKTIAPPAPAAASPPVRTPAPSPPAPAATEEARLTSPQPAGSGAT
ncbi:cell wall hydrolase [Phenylobacterium sp. SCN 70-31]|uniref:cell wall hydrolase n=1 Tax=Phenylobacterium sp. SCN 70-31 TaxID=1660129 RepID=UPI000A82B325|nr:cell wall hydrolase [Phenylobacterium sp. SCN 70-31]